MTFFATLANYRSIAQHSNLHAIWGGDDLLRNRLRSRDINFAGGVSDMLMLPTRRSLWSRDER